MRLAHLMVLTALAGCAASPEPAAPQRVGTAGMMVRLTDKASGESLKVTFTSGNGSFTKGVGDGRKLTVLWRLVESKPGADVYEFSCNGIDTMMTSALIEYRGTIMPVLEGTSHKVELVRANSR